MSVGGWICVVALVVWGVMTAGFIWQVYKAPRAPPRPDDPDSVDTVQRNEEGPQ